jgi:hypothetical protein
MRLLRHFVPRKDIKKDKITPTFILPPQGGGNEMIVNSSLLFPSPLGGRGSG